MPSKRKRVKNPPRFVAACEDRLDSDAQKGAEAARHFDSAHQVVHAVCRGLP